jgi:hypothetical protein
MPKTTPPASPANNGSSVPPLLIAVAALAAGLLIGYLAGKGGRPAPQPPAQPPAQPAAETEEEPLAEDADFSRETAPRTQIAGTIGSIEGSVIVLLTGDNAGADEPGPSERRVTVTSSTEYFASIRKDDEQYRLEVEEYQKAGDQEAAPPQVTELKKISFADLREGDSILVEASEDIGASAAFTAVRVTVLVGGATSAAATPPPPGAPPASSGPEPSQPPPPPAN